MDGYNKVIAEALATGNRSLLESASRMRESDGDGLIDLSGTGLPMVDESERSAPVAIKREPADDGKLLDLAGAGVPLAESAPTDGQQLLTKMRESDRVKDAESAAMLDLRALGIPVREASYGGVDPETPEVYVQDANTLPLLKDLYVCVPEQLDNGSENLENEQVRRLIEDVEKGHALSVVQLGLMKTLVAAHAGDIRALRQSGQSYTSVPAPDPSTGRHVTDDDREAGLLDLGPTVPKAAA